MGNKSFSLITEPLIAAIPCLVKKCQKLFRPGAALNSLSVLVVHFFFFYLVPVNKEEPLSSWKISTHSLNIWTAFCSVCKRGRAFGQQLSCRPLGHEAVRAGREGSPPRWEMAAWGAISEWVFHQGCRRDLFVHFATVNSRSLQNDQAVFQVPFLQGRWFELKESTRSLPATSENVGQPVGLFCSGCHQSSGHKCCLSVGSEVCCALGVQVESRVVSGVHHTGVYGEILLSFPLLT